MNLRRLAAATAVLSLVLVACGQFKGVHERAVQLVPGANGGVVGGGAGTVPGESGPVPGEAGTIPGEAGTVPGGTTGGTVPTGTTGGTTGGIAGGTTGAGTQVRGGDTTGVTPTTIKIAIHAPLTGAAPLKASSFDAGKDLYWKKGDNGKPVKIFGRRVEVVFQDDQYNPSHARLVCQQMAEGQKSFLLIGGGGTDQIQACAQYAASRGIPYLSAGVTEIGMRRLKNYFALSMSYAQQAKLLAQYIKAQARAGVTGFSADPKKVAAVITNTANFDDAVDAFTQAFPGVKVFRPDKNERGSSRASSLCTGALPSYDVVFPLTAPAYYLEMASAAKCKPTYAGVGVSMGLDQVADLGCKSDESTKNARFFSPAPSFEDVRNGKWDPLFSKVAASNADDIVWLLWGLSKTVHQLLLSAGQNLTREGFIAAAERASVRTGVFPELRYSPQDHFGAFQVHVLKNVCLARGNASGYYVTEAAFKSSF